LFRTIEAMKTKNIFLTVLFLSIISIVAQAQTVIEMADPADVNLVLLEVDSPEKADIIVYKTEDKNEYQEWNLKWKFKSWGFSNFAIYLTKDEKDPMLVDEETGQEKLFNAKIYFTDSPEKAKYNDPNFRLEGVFRKVASNE